jgi:hypothetical protein
MRANRVNGFSFGSSRAISSPKSRASWSLRMLLVSIAPVTVAMFASFRGQDDYG